MWKKNSFLLGSGLGSLECGMGQSHACFCILLSALQSKICKIDITAVLGAAPKEELERLHRELESRLGSGAGAKEQNSENFRGSGSGSPPLEPSLGGSLMDSLHEKN